MISIIRVYVYPDTLRFFNNNRQITRNIISDHHVVIKNINIKNGCYIEIQGLFEDVHKARIIIQDLERENYRSLFLKPN